MSEEVKGEMEREREGRAPQGGTGWEEVHLQNPPHPRGHLHHREPLPHQHRLPLGVLLDLGVQAQ